MSFEEAQQFLIDHSQTDLGLHVRPTPHGRPPVEALVFATPPSSPPKRAASASASDTPLTLEFGSLSITVVKKD
eukprot:13499593-Alexandrium_andersonii.AAC.1